MTELAVIQGGKKPVRLHIGCGHARWPGFVNVDRNDHLKMGPPDLKVEAIGLPYKDGEVDEIQAIHIFEHIHRSESDAVLTEWYRVLRRGGKLVMEMPCLDKIAKMIVEGEKNIRMTTLGLFGDPTDPNKDMDHKWCWGEDEMRSALDQVGFRQVEFPPVKFHIQRRDFRVEAVKP